MDGNTDMIPQDTQEKPVNTPGLTMIALSRARIWPGNPRKTIPDLADLTESVRKVGVLAPLLMRELLTPLHTEEGGLITHEVLAGQCRFLSAVAAGLAEVPANVCAVDDAVALELALTENFGRHDSPPLEDAAALHQLVTEHKRTVEQVAASIGRPVQWVRRRLSLLALCERARIKLTHGDLPLTHAYQLAQVDHETQERVLTRYGQSEVPSAKIFAREVTSSLRTLQSAPFAIDDAKLPGGPCGGCSRRTDAQTDLFGGAETGARCLGAECWDGKVAATWERAQKGARRRKGLAVIQDTITLSHDHTCVVRGDVLTARPQEGEDPVAVARTAWGKVVDLWLPAEKAAPAKAPADGAGSSGDASGPSDEDTARAAQKAQESARKAAAAEEKRATLARLCDALCGSNTGHATGMRVALLTLARDLDMSRDLRAVVDATGRPTFAHTDEDLIADVPNCDLSMILAATIVSAWALDKDAEDGTNFERSLREMIVAREKGEPAEEMAPVGQRKSVHGEFFDEDKGGGGVGPWVGAPKPCPDCAEIVLHPGERAQCPTCGAVHTRAREFPETAPSGAEVTHAIHPATGAVMMGDDVERITGAVQEKAKKPGKKGRK